MQNRIPDLEERILHEDDELLVVDKPYGIPTAGRTLEDDDGVQFWVIRRAGTMVWVVNQLDADTTGVNLFVKEKRLVQRYMDLLLRPDTEKIYLAVVHGEPEWDEIDVRSPIGKVDGRSLGVCAEGRSAHSHFEVVDRSDGFSLMKARIFTGRTHQIRIHLSHTGHPVVGDDWYCNPPCMVHHRQALHAWKLLLGCGPRNRLAAPLPNDFRELAVRVGLDCPG